MKTNHRVAAGSKSARQMAARNGNFYVPAPVDRKTQQEINAWNAAVDAKKAAKKQRTHERKSADMIDARVYKPMMDGGAE